MDDEPALRDVLADALEGAGYASGAAPDGETALERLAAERFDLVVLDVVLPHTGGLEVRRELRERGDNTPIVLLTGRDQTADKIRGLGLGADDYVTKPFDTGELLARIHALLRRTAVVQRRIAGSESTPEMYQFGGVAVDLIKGKLSRRGQPVSIPAKEMELLRYLIARRGVTVSREELLREVWNYQSALTRTVDVHVAGLRQKVEENPEQPSHIVTVRGQGYRFRG